MNSTTRVTMPETFTLADSFSHRLNVVARRVTQIFARRYVAECGVNISEWRVLAVVAERGPISPSQVSVAAEMDKVKVSRAVATLVQRGFLKQVTDARDGRMRILSLTRKGASAHAQAAEITRDLETSLAAPVARGDWALMGRVLAQLDATAIGLGAGTTGGEEE